MNRVLLIISTLIGSCLTQFTPSDPETFAFGNAKYLFRDHYRPLEAGRINVAEFADSLGFEVACT
jgi:hypothetical protein